MKNSFLFLLVFMSLNAKASTTIEMEGKSLDCEKKSEQIFHCKNASSKVLVVKNFMGYMAVEKNGDELPKSKWLSKVVDDDKLLYETPKFPGSGGGYSDNRESSEMEGEMPGGDGGYGGGMGTYKIPDDKSRRLSEANTIVVNLKDIKDSWASDFVDVSQKYITVQSVKRSQLQIKDYNGEIFNCKEGHTRKLTVEEVAFQERYNTKIVCNYYSCSNKAGEKSLAFIPSPASMSGGVSFLKLKADKSEVRYDGFKVVDTDVTQVVPIYDIPAYPKYDLPGGFKPDFDQKLLTPKKYQNNESTFDYLTNPMNTASTEEEENYCYGDNEVRKLIEEKHRVADKMKEDLANTDLAHYLTMTDGQMVSLLVDVAKSHDLGCRYENMILSPSAEAHLDYLRKVKPRPVEKYLSITEVQKLFKKAKNMSDIPFGYKDDGCYARAHVMARRFEEMGIPTEKAWIKGSLFVPGTDIKWNYHVAPVINVKDKKGKIKKYVIDPSLADNAVTLDEWVESMGKNVKGGVMKTRYPFPVNAANFQRTAVALSSSDVYVPDNDEVKTEEQNMAMAIQTMKEYTAVLNEGNK
ncbi:MAG: protein-glutamine glutaminase family protein [Bacteriovorax sp.]|nr:protein-glutamine glutaminase family protein [Bacteriovorax sp.]